MADPYLAELTRLRQQTSDYFYYHRRGEADDWDEQSREEVFSFFQRPLAGPFLGTFYQSNLQPLHEYEAGERGYIEPYEPPGPPDEVPDMPPFTMELVREQAWHLRKYDGLVFNRVIGAGGQGAIALYDLTLVGQYRNQQVVVKIQYNLQACDREIAGHNRLRKAAHIVQMMDFPGKLTPYQAGPSHDRQQRRIGDIPGDQEDPNAPLEGVIVLEYFRRLHLGRYLGHFGEMKRLNPAMPWFSNKQLWSMASCLFLPLMSMQYPPESQPGFDEDGGLVMDALPPQGAAAVPSSRLVHFDIDPSNYFVGDYNVNIENTITHQTLPIIKLGDLGLMEEVGLLFQAPFSLPTCCDVWRLRMKGKEDFFAPESFVEEWDYIAAMPPPNAVAAGKWGSPTNVYQFGWTLFGLITGCNPPTGPVDRRRDWDNMWTYGLYLMNERFNDIDIAFRRLAVQCLRESPACRPPLSYIQMVMTQKLAAPWPETDAETRNWAHFFFGGNPPRKKRAQFPVIKKWLDGKIPYEELLEQAINDGV